VIVIAADASDRSDDAIAFARMLNEASGARLVITTAQHGSPALEIERVAEQEGAALIVVGSSHRGPVGRLFPGSTGLQLLHRAQRPIAVVPRGYAAARKHEFARVGCAWEPSTVATRALNEAAAAARGLGARLVVIHVFDTCAADARALVGAEGGISNLADYERSAREDIEDAIAGLAIHVAVEAELVEGAPDAVLAARSEQLDLLVAGSRGQGSVRAVLLGGVTHRLLHTAACPVIVLPPAATRGLQDVFSA
jgi:nucleotide-binding universal stress UspA family protein